jgi:CBS domain-containing protein
MAKVQDIMTRNVVSIQASDTLQAAAQRMRELNIGALPVCEGDALVGMVTDRDIAVRGVAGGLAPKDARVSEVMTTELRWCREADDVEHALELMGNHQVRRLAVVDLNHKIVGIVALGDMATRQSAPTDAALRDISERSPPE